MEPTKECNLCHQSKPLTEFYKASNTPDKLGYTCKECSRARTLAWNKANPEKYAATQKRYQVGNTYRAARKARREGDQRETILAQKRASYDRHRAEILEKNQARRGDPALMESQRARYVRWKEKNPRGQLAYSIKRTYGMTLEDYDALVVEQCGKCAVCSTQLAHPHVDHNHVTGKVRGLLCGPCNMGLGMFNENPAWFHAAADYLDRTN